MREYFRIIIGAALTAALFGCEAPPPLADTPPTPTSVPSKPAERAFSAYDFQWFPPQVGIEEGGPPRRLRGLDNAQLRAALKLANENVDCGDYKNCAKTLRRKLNRDGDDGRKNPLVGLGGSGVATLIDVAEVTAEGDTVTVWAKGQIQTQCLAADGSPQPKREGYDYSSATGELRICVVVRTTTMNMIGEKVSTFEYFEVHANNARHEETCADNTVDPRCVDHGASNANVFPIAAQKTGLKIPKSKTTPVPGVQLNWKLYAWGTNISVKRYGLIEGVVWADPNTEPTPVWNSGNLYDRWQGNGQLTQRLRKLFTHSDEACIDMMFVDEPPASLVYNERVVYCLGRCKNPPILNTL